jgi:hypothetical protein
MKDKQHRRKKPGKKKRSPDSTLPFPIDVGLDGDTRKVGHGVLLWWRNGTARIT